LEIPQHIRFLLSKSVQKNAPRFILQWGHFWIPLHAKNSLNSFLFTKLVPGLKRKEGRRKFAEVNFHAENVVLRNLIYKGNVLPTPIGGLTFSIISLFIINTKDK